MKAEFGHSEVNDNNLLMAERHIPVVVIVGGVIPTTAAGATVQLGPVGLGAFGGVLEEGVDAVDV